MKKFCEHCANLRKDMAKKNERLMEKLPLDYMWKDAEEIKLAEKINDLIDFTHKYHGRI